MGRRRGRKHGDGVHEPLTSIIWHQEDVGEQTSIEDIVHMTTPDELFSQDNSYVLEFLKSSSIHKLGELTVKDQAALSQLGDKPLLTLGTSDPAFDWKAAWQNVLGVGHKDRRNAEEWGNEVTVEAWVLTVRGAVAPDHEGLLYPILKSYQTGGSSLSMFGLPSMQAVIDFKWKTFARTFVYLELLFLLVWLSSFTTLGLIISNPAGGDPVGLWFHVANVCNLLALVAAVPFFLIEVANIIDYGLHWFTVWNVTEMASCILQGVFFVTHLEGNLDDSWLSSLIAIQNLFLWVRFFFLARALKTSKKASLIDILGLVCVELKDFVIFCALLLWAFAFSFHVLFRKDGVSAFRNVGESLMNVLKWMKAGSDMNIVSVVKSHALATCVLLVLFQLVMAMMMMSLLIGVVNRSVVKAGENQELKAYAAQAVMMVDIETTLPSWIERMFPQSWYPKYLHIMRIKPSSLAVVDTKYTWQSSRAVTSNPNAPVAKAPSRTLPLPAAPSVSSAEASAEIVALTKQLGELQSTLQTQTELIHKLLAASTKPAEPAE